MLFDVTKRELLSTFVVVGDNGWLMIDLLMDNFMLFFGIVEQPSHEDELADFFFFFLDSILAATLLGNNAEMSSSNFFLFPLSTFFLGFNSVGIFD